MAVAFVNSGAVAADAAATTIASAAQSLTIGNSLVANIIWDGTAGTSVSSVTDTIGNAYTRRAGFIDSVGGAAIDCWNVPSSSATNANNVVTATFSAAVSFRRIHVRQYSYAGGTTFTFDQTSNTQNGAASTAQSTPAVTTTLANSVIIGAYFEAASVTFTAGTGFGNLQLGGAGDASEDEIVAATGSFNTTMTVSAAVSWWALETTFGEIGGAAVTPIRQFPFLPGFGGGR